MSYKIAVCLSGQLRKIYNLSAVKEALSDYEVDYYVHTWDHKYNINLPTLHDYLPEATVEIETYDNFDTKIREIIGSLPDGGTVNDIHTRRYNFVQYYTILKSLLLARRSNKKYDFYIRIRSDIELIAGKVTREKFSHFNKQSKNATKHLFDHGAVDISKKEITGVVSAKIMYAREVVSLRDYLWVAEPKAFNVLTSVLDEYSVLDLVYNIVNDWKSEKLNIDEQLTCALAEAFPAPVIWPEIFNRLGIMVLDTDIHGSIIRDADDKENKVSCYGVIK